MGSGYLSGVGVVVRVSTDGGAGFGNVSCGSGVTGGSGFSIGSSLII